MEDPVPGSPASTRLELATKKEEASGTEYWCCRGHTAIVDLVGVERRARRGWRPGAHQCARTAAPWGAAASAVRAGEAPHRHRHGADLPMQR